MMVTIQSCVRRGRRLLRGLQGDARALAVLQGLGYFLAGFLLSGASLGHHPQPLCLGLLCGAPAGWPLLLLALGSSGGYLHFWGNAGLQGVAWTLCGLLCAGFLSGRRIHWRIPLLMPSIATLIVSGVGVVFQIFLGDRTSVTMYLLQVLLAGGSARLFTLAFEGRDSFVDWTVEGVAVLALCQVTISPWLGLGYVGAATLGVGSAFPAAALAGLAIDLSQITKVPMTAVLCVSYLVRLLPWTPKRIRWMIPAAMYLIVMGLCGFWDLHPLPGLLLGGITGMYLPARSPAGRRKGELGIAQVRLEMAAGVLAQAEQTLLETPEHPVDEQAIVARAAERACTACPCRKGCRDREHMPAMSTKILHKPGLQTIDVPIPCRKVGRMTAELQRGQEQLRSILADREVRRDYRDAVVQQYQFLSSYLRGLSDDLGRSVEGVTQRYQPEVAVCSIGKEPANGDRCLWFAGTGCRYYVLLVDGMGTGLGAAQEAKAAGDMVRRLLGAGFPPEHALRSLNSLCALRGRAGAVSVDLAEIQLDTGGACLYKWGAAPSYLLTRSGTEKIGTAGAPPGLSVTEGRETVDRLSLRRGETLVMLSDGVDGEDVPRRAAERWREPPGEIAAAVLETVDEDQGDDATAAVVRLRPVSSATQ